MSATLVWTDYPGLPSASFALVNNLDLEVTPPGSSVTLFGNNFNNSIRPQMRDFLNNVEKVYLANPTPTLDASGATRLTAPYKIGIRGQFVPYGPQAYSLVVTGLGARLVSTFLCDGSPSSVSGTTDPKTVAIAILGSIIGIFLIFIGVYLALQHSKNRLLQAKVQTSKQQGEIEMPSSVSAESPKPQAV